MSEQNDNPQLELQVVEVQVLHSYTRKQAIADGILIDAEKQFPGLSSQAGFKFPIAITARAFSRYIELNPNAVLESPKARMGDVLWMLILKIKLTKNQRLDTLRFSFLCTVPDYPEPFAIETNPLKDNEDDEDDFLSLEQILAQAEQNQKLCWLKAVVSPDEDGNGCITIMLPWED
jgi:hypothetical protein